MTLLERLTTTRAAGAPDRLKVLVHGPAGAGKTTLLGTTPEPDRTLVVSAEAGLMPLRHVDLAALEVTGIEQLRQLHAELKASEGRFTWVCLDSVSEIAEVCLATELRNTRDGRAAYGEMQRVMTGLLRAYRDLPCHVVMTCKQGKVQDEAGRIMRGPLLPGRTLTQNVTYMFDLVLSLRCDTDEEGNVRRALQTAPADYHEAKDRSGVLGVMEPPDLAAIHRKIVEEATH